MKKTILLIAMIGMSFGLIAQEIEQGSILIEENLTVAGKILTREVNVTIDAGADFVFEDSYNLMTIEELGAFVKKNMCLPGINPAIEMEANGADLGKLNIKLLQKIEELTLYTIQQQEMINSLRVRLAKLEESSLSQE